jgi:hypothetical protein
MPEKDSLTTPEEDSLTTLANRMVYDAVCENHLAIDAEEEAAEAAAQEKMFAALAVYEEYVKKYKKLLEKHKAEETARKEERIFILSLR